MKPSSWTSALVVVLFVAAVWFKLQRPPDHWEGKPAPDFGLPVIYDPEPGADAKAQRVRLSDLKGQLVLLDFWASWCEPCRQSVPGLNEVAKLMAAEGVQVYGINSENHKPAVLQQVADRWGIAYPVLHDPTARAQLAYDVQALPSLFLIDRAGIVHKSHAGSPSTAQLLEEVRALARSSPPASVGK